MLSFYFFFTLLSKSQKSYTRPAKHQLNTRLAYTHVKSAYMYLAKELAQEPD